MTRFIVMTSTAQMPSSVKARYRNIAIVQLKAGFEGQPKMISLRARGVEAIVYRSGACHLGSGGPRTEAEITRRAATRVCRVLDGSLAVLALVSTGEVGTYVRSLMNEYLLRE